MSFNKNISYKYVTFILFFFLVVLLFKSYTDTLTSNEDFENLKKENLITQNQLTEIIEKHDSLSMNINTNSSSNVVEKIGEKPKNQNAFSNNSKFEIIQIQVKGITFISENETYSNENFFNQLRVCFTIDKNEKISQGEKEIFIQVINPKNEIISANNLNFETIKYTKLAKFFYQQQITDVCSFVNLEKNKIIKGKYQVNLYNGTSKLGTSYFNYK